MGLLLYLDDVRDIPNTNHNVVVARSFNEAIEVFDRYKDDITHLSLDHDLGEPKTGYDFLKYIADKYSLKGMTIVCHSANPVGRANIESYISLLLRKGML